MEDSYYDQSAAMLSKATCLVDWAKRPYKKALAQWVHYLKDSFSSKSCDKCAKRRL